MTVYCVNLIEILKLYLINKSVFAMRGYIKMILETVNVYNNNIFNYKNTFNYNNNYNNNLPYFIYFFL